MQENNRLPTPLAISTSQAGLFAVICFSLRSGILEYLDILHLLPTSLSVTDAGFGQIFGIGVKLL